MKTRDERRQAEMERGQTVLAQRALSARFNPEHDDWASKSEGARPMSAEAKEYARQMAERNKDREDFK